MRKVLSSGNFSDNEDGLQSTALADIAQLLEELRQLSRKAETDAGKIRRRLLMLQVCFQDLTATAEMLAGKLEERISVQAARRLIAYAERFTSDLVIAADRLSGIVRDIEGTGFQLSLELDWKPIRNWLISQPGRPSNADMLRERVRASILTLLRIISADDQQLKRVDRSNDFRVLARWFAETTSDDEAHRLWRAVFGLSPARHLIINDATLDDYEAQDVSAGTSWMDAPPFRISTRRPYRNNSQVGSLSRIIDRSAEKEKLADATREEALRILNAQSRFGSGRRTRLSELDGLETGEFDLLLDLLGEAMSARLFPSEAVEILSADGRLRVKLEPTDDGREAMIMTPEGVFSGPDHWISVERITFEEMQDVEMTV